MKRKMTNSIAIALTVLLSVMTFVPTAHGQQPKRKPVADTAVLTPAEGQTVRITAAPGFGVDDVSVVLAWKMYMTEGCSGTPAVCRHMVTSQGSTPVQMLGANDAISRRFGNRNKWTASDGLCQLGRSGAGSDHRQPG
jgi:hypothetical protein